MTIYRYYDIKNSERINIPFMSNNDAVLKFDKGWGYSYVYSFTELRDMFLAVKRHGVYSTTDFLKKHVENKIPFSKSKWTHRRVIEVLNALINFGLIDKEYKVINFNVFIESEIGGPLTQSDKEIFKDVFFNYFRFKELLLLYKNPQLLFSVEKEVDNINKYNIINDSKILFHFLGKDNYVNSFFLKLEDNPLIYVIPEFNNVGDKNSGVRRFWDVFISWGENLGILEKFNMTSVGCKLSNKRTFVCSYILSDKGITQPLLQFIKEFFPNKRSIDLSQLVFQLCTHFRVSVKYAKEYIINEYKRNSDIISLVRTSEIFIKEKEFSAKEKVFYPQYKDSFISHIILRI